MRRAHRAGRDAARQRDRRLPIGVHDRGFEQRGVNHLAFAGAVAMLERGEDARAGEDAGRDVGDRRPDLDGRPAGPFPGDAHQPAHALGDEIVAAAIGIRPGAAEARNGAVDEPRIVLA